MATNLFKFLFDYVLSLNHYQGPGKYYPDCKNDVVLWYSSQQLFRATDHGGTLENFFGCLNLVN